MCGIFGVVARTNTVTPTTLKEASDTLLAFSASRGKASSGIAFYQDDGIDVYKIPSEAAYLIRDPTYANLFRDNKIVNEMHAFIGHTRLVTNGDESFNYNNQPVIKDSIVGVHNGIIVNDAALWDKHPDINRNYDVDTEIILGLIRKELNNGISLDMAVAAVYKEISGTASIALFLEDMPYLVLATNNGSLYFARDSDNAFHAFASEKVFLAKLLNRSEFRP